jgi:ribosomal protein L40E
MNKIAESQKLLITIKGDNLAAKLQICTRCAAHGPFRAVTIDYDAGSKTKRMRNKRELGPFRTVPCSDDHSMHDSIDGS